MYGGSEKNGLVRALVGLCLCALSSPLCGQPKSTFVIERDIPARLSPFTAWNGRKIIGVDTGGSQFSPAPVIYSIDPNEPYRRREEFLFTIPESNGINISSTIAGSPDGAVALFGSAYTNDSRGTTFLAWISPDRKRQVVTRVWPYSAYAIAIAADGAIWMAGFLKDVDNTRTVADGVLRRYEPNGRMAASWVVQAKGNRRMPRATTLGSFLMASKDRVAWLTAGGEYIEFSLDGMEITRLQGPEWVDFDRGASRQTWHLSGVALSPENDAALCIARGDTWQVLVLDRQRRSWSSALGDQKGWADLVGFDGQRLVTVIGSGELGTVRLLNRSEAR
jgi:hypothetical protein